ncbi:hypothetical protein IOD13_08725 [Brevibacterium casei]|nr:hypothetical protein [Brevibacterium casei]
MTADLAQTTEAKSSTWFESLAVFVAMVLTAIGLSAVFSDLGWSPPVLVAVALIVAVGAIFRRHRRTAGHRHRRHRPVRRRRLRRPHPLRARHDALRGHPHR